MKKLWFRKLFFIILLGDILFLFSNSAYASSPYVTGSNFNLIITQDSGLGFQNSNPIRYVLLTPTSGDLNSSTNSLRIYSGGGTFQFLSNETFTMQITYDVSNVKVKGDQGTTELRYITSGTSINVNAGDTVVLNWDVTIEPLLPLLFIMGMFGIISTFGGSLYAVNEFKKKNWEKGFVNGVIYVTLGICLVLAWLWG